MFKLMKLEMKKSNYPLNLLFAVIVIGGLFVFELLSFKGGYEGAEQYTSFSFILNNIILFNKYAWTIYGSVLIAKLYGEEINARTTNILFTYPVSRTKIAIVKYIFILQFILIGFWVSSILQAIGMITINKSISVFSDGVHMELFSEYVYCVLLSGLFSAFATFIVLLINILTKSSKATIVSSVVIIVALYQGGKTNTSFMSSDLILYGILGVIGIICSVIGIQKLQTMDL